LNLERTSNTIITNTTFQDGNGRYIYGWLGNLDIVGSTFLGKTGDYPFDGEGKGLYSID